MVRQLRRVMLCAAEVNQLVLQFRNPVPRESTLRIFRIEFVNRIIDRLIAKLPIFLHLKEFSPSHYQVFTEDSSLLNERRSLSTSSTPRMRQQVKGTNRLRKSCWNRQRMATPESPTSYSSAIEIYSKHMLLMRIKNTKSSTGEVA